MLYAYGGTIVKQGYLKKLSYLSCVLLFFFTAGKSFACSCAGYTWESAVKSSDIIYVANVYWIEVVEQANEIDFIGGKRRGHFEIIETLKGEPQGPHFIETVDKEICCLCHAVVQPNQRYLVFANSDGIPYFSSCSPTTALSGENEAVVETVRQLIANDQTDNDA